jgi:transcriptional regulator EpsA
VLNIPGESAAVPDTPFASETLALVLESGVHIALRRQFFGWTQGAVQALIRHEVLMCAVSRHGAAPAVELFSCRPLPATFMTQACAVETGLYARLNSAWERSGRRPVTLDDPASANKHSGLETDEAPSYSRCFAAHGIDSGHGYPRTLFVFCGVPKSPNADPARALALLTPYLHAAWLRILDNSAGASPIREPRGREPLTPRERQILGWLHAGRRNAEIADALAISPNTVKNHVQKILRKMDAENRAQAVAKAQSLNLFEYVSDPARRL